MHATSRLIALSLDSESVDPRVEIARLHSGQWSGTGCNAWVDGKSRLRRVTLELEHGHQAIVNRRTADNELRVDFAYDNTLGMLRPREMRETFALRGGGRFDGRAVYSDFKRFTTAARIIPQ